LKQLKSAIASATEKGGGKDAEAEEVRNVNKSK